MASLPAMSVQLYSVREQLATDFSGTMARLAQIGLTRVEPFAMVEHAAELKIALADNGLSAPTTHQSLVEVDLDAVFETATDLGIATVIHPYTDAELWSSEDGVATLADALNTAAATAASHGLRVGYHNHDWEVRNTFDGQTALERFVGLLDPSVVLEIDCYWAAFGGQDVPALIGRLGGRVVALHLKDGPLNGVIAEQLPLGSGQLPAAEIVAAATSVEVPVLEFDQYAGDIFEGVATGYAFATATLGAER